MPPGQEAALEAEPEASPVEYWRQLHRASIPQGELEHRTSNEGGKMAAVADAPLQGWRQRAGVIGSRFGKRQAALHLLGKTDLAEEGNETGQPAEGGDGLGHFVQNQPGIAKERGNFGAGRFVQGRAGWFKHQSLCPQPLPQSAPFFHFGVRA